LERNRLISGCVAVLWLGALAVVGLGTFLKGILALLLPLACIWFPDELGSMTTSLPSLLSGMPITRTSPGSVVRVVGWVLLLTLTILPIIIAIMNSL